MSYNSIGRVVSQLSPEHDVIDIKPRFKQGQKRGFVQSISSRAFNMSSNKNDRGSISSLFELDKTDALVAGDPLDPGKYPIKDPTLNSIKNSQDVVVKKKKKRKFSIDKGDYSKAYNSLRLMEKATMHIPPDRLLNNTNTVEDYMDKHKLERQDSYRDKVQQRRMNEKITSYFREKIDRDLE